MDPSDVQAALDALPTSDVSQELDLGTLTSAQITSVQSLVSQGLLPDIGLEVANPQVMVAYDSGIGLLDVRHLVVTLSVQTDAPATSIALNYSDATGTAVRTDQSSYAAAGDSLVLLKVDETKTPWAVTEDTSGPLKMPGPVTTVLFDRASRVAQALGRTPDGSGWTVYAIETNGNAIFSDARLPFQPVSIGLDSSPNLPQTDREQVLAFSATGSMATVDVGQFAFSWRIMGVIFGTLMAVCLYLLVRILFRRRSIGLLVALFSLTDGMLFVQSRIAMNDTYVGGFLLLAYLLFAIMWLRVWKSQIVFWAGMPILGVILGVALGSKWVALYAMASIGFLILIRSALGRLITILGLALGTGVLGWMAIAEMTTTPNTGKPALVVLLIGLGLVAFVGGLVWASSMRTTPDKYFIGGVGTAVAGGLFAAALTMTPNSLQNGAPNYLFFLIMLAITAIGAAANAYHPIAWTREELRFAIGAPIVLGVLAGLAGVLRHNRTLIEVGGAGIAVGVLAVVAFWFAGTLGFGPLAPPPGPNDPARYADPPAPAPTGWLRLGSGLGLPAAWMAACLIFLPIVVYVGTYVPWAMPWQQQTDATGQLPSIACWHTNTTTGLCDNSWPAGHTGQNLWDLTIEMYNYHNDLRSAHPAASPWWAWPLDLKPVWFENANYAGDTATMIYDGGNPALWWLAVFGMGFIAWQAFKRRSLGLTLIAMAFFWQWLSWARIDRAAFQYHFYTALPFFLVALAYFLAELWHGPSRRTWLLARVAAAAALLFPAVAWLLKYPLCGLARVGTSDYFGNVACGSGTGDVRVEARMLYIGVTLVVALVVLGLLLWRLERRARAGKDDPYWVVQMIVPVVVAGGFLWWFGQNGPRDVLFQAALPSDGIALVLLPVLAILAFIALTARNPRRYVLGACSFAVVAFVALYPNLSALPLPSTIINVYEGLLPTWFYGFQFSVNLQVSNQVSPSSATGLTLALGALLVAGVAAWAAWERRIVIGYRRSRLLAPDGEAPGDGEASEPGDQELPSQATSADAAAGSESAAGSRKDKPEN